MADEGLLTLDEAAAYLGFAKITSRRWTRNGHLSCVRIGLRGDRRFKQADLDTYIRRNASPKPRSKATKRKATRKTKRPLKKRWSGPDVLDSWGALGP